MARMLRRVRPTRLTLIALAGFIWAVSFGAVRDFVWADLREGMIDLKGLTRPARAIVWLGFGLMLLMVLALLFNDLWRAASPLLPLTQTIPGRGALLPVALLPVTLFLLAVSWAFILAGALHSHRWIRLALLFLFIPEAGLWLSTSLNTAAISGVGVGLIAGIVATLAVIVIYAVRWRRPERPVAEFALLLIATGVLFVSSHAQDVADWQTWGMPVMVVKIEAAISFLDSLIMPLLILIGVDIAAFAQQAAQWTTRVAVQRFPRLFLTPALVLILVWRLAIVAPAALDRVTSGEPGAGVPAYAGALIVPLLILLAWWGGGRLSAAGRTRQTEAAPTAGSISEETHRVALPLILVFNGVELLVFIILWLSLGLLPLPGLVTRISGLADVVGAQTELWRILVGIGAVGLAVSLAWRGRRSLATFLAAFALVHLWYEATNPGRPLAALTWRGSEPVDFWLVVALTGLTVYWLLVRRLTRPRAAALFFAALVTALLRETSFIESPFSPFLSFAGIGFVAFGIMWDALTAGSWANQGSPALPRISRIFLYLGYVLLTVTTINWAVTGHNLFSAGLLTGELASLGLERFGKPLLYVIIVAVLAGALPEAGEPRFEEEREGQ